MADLIITHRIEAPELAAALNNLADALKSRPVAFPIAKTASPEPVQTATPTTPECPTVAATTPDTSAANGPVASVPNTPVNVPTISTEKVYTFEDITKAGSQLLEQGKMQQLMDLLKGYGVQAVTQLKPEQYADVAAGLQRLGANI